MGPEAVDVSSILRQRSMCVFSHTYFASLSRRPPRHNDLTGTIPLTSMMQTLELLYLYNNSFTGTLSNDFQSDWNLRKFKVSNNSLTGEIPSNLGVLKGLEILSLNGAYVGFLFVFLPAFGRLVNPFRADFRLDTCSPLQATISREIYRKHSVNFNR